MTKRIITCYCDFIDLQLIYEYIRMNFIIIKENYLYLRDNDKYIEIKYNLILLNSAKKFLTSAVHLTELSKFTFIFIFVFRLILPKKMVKRKRTLI